MAWRFHCENQTLEPGRVVELNDAESHHLLKVMRAKPGTIVHIFANGSECRGRFIGTHGSNARIELEQIVLPPAPPRIPLHFVIPWIRGGRTETLVQKLTELGASSIIAYHATREVVKSDNPDRLIKTALVACKQCERADLPGVKTVTSGQEAIRMTALAKQHVFLLHERVATPLLSEALRRALTQSEKVPGLQFISGPEGGFAEAELELMRDLVTPVSLGRRILRAETAPIAAAAVALALTGEM